MVRFSQVRGVAAVASFGNGETPSRNWTARRHGRDYRFLTTWLLEAERAPVWDAIFDQKRWPSWWRGVEDVVELDPGDEAGRRLALAPDLAVEAALRPRLRGTTRRSTSPG